MHFIVTDQLNAENLAQACKSVLGRVDFSSQGSEASVAIVGNSQSPYQEWDVIGERVGFVAGDPVALLPPPELVRSLIHRPEDIRNLEINHPNVTSVVELNSGRLFLRTDENGGAPVFFISGPSGTGFSSSPDLLAYAFAPLLDVTSCWELRSQGKVTFPFTLYKGISQLDPRRDIHAMPLSKMASLPSRLVTFRRRGQPRKRFGRAIQVDALADSFFSHITSIQGNKHVTLSAGVDSRFILDRLLLKGGGLESALTMVPSPNEQSEAASFLAQVAGVPHTTHLWSRELFKARWATRAGFQVPSHNLWSHSHFQGYTFDLKPTVVLGGYFCDTALVGKGILYQEKRRLLEASSGQGLSAWIVNDHWQNVPSQARLVLDARSRALAKTLPRWISATPDLYLSWPYSRAGTAGHFLSQYHQWPHYEFFMTSWAAQASAEVVARRFEPGLKEELLKPLLKDLSSPPLNPRGGSNWLSLGSIMKDSPAWAETLNGLAAEGQEGLKTLSIARDIPTPKYLSADIQIGWAKRCTNRDLS